jgi:hypothetical protein
LRDRSRHLRATFIESANPSGHPFSRQPGPTIRNPGVLGRNANEYGIRTTSDICHWRGHRTSFPDRACGCVLGCTSGLDST